MELLESCNFSQEMLSAPAAPEAAEAWAMVDQLNIQLESLQAIYREVSLEGRISRDQATYLVEDLGLDFGSHYPLNSFTMEASATNLAIATETLGGGLLASIGEFIKKVVTIIVSILKWIFEVLTGYSSRRENVARVAENIKAAAKTNRELEAAMAKLPAPPPASQQLTDTDNHYQKVMAAYDVNWRDFRDQVITHGDFVQFLRQFSVYILAFMPLLNERVVIFRKLIEAEEKPGDAGHQVSLKAQFARLMEPVPTAPLQRALQHAHLGLGHKYNPLSRLHEPTLLDVAVAINQRFTALLEGKTTSPVQVSSCAEVIENNPKIIEPYLVKDHEEKALIGTLIKDYEKILALRPKQSYSDELRDQYKKVVEELTKEVQALQMLVDTYSSADRERMLFLKDLGDAVFATNQVLEEKIASYPEASQKPLREILNRGRSLLQRLR